MAFVGPKIEPVTFWQIQIARGCVGRYDRRNEQIGADVSTDVSRVREDTSLESRVRRAGEEVISTEMGDAEALMRSGREEVRERDVARRAREEAGYQDFRPVQVTRPDGRTVSVRAETRKGSSVLREINRLLAADNPRGFISTIQNARRSDFFSSCRLG